MVTKLDPRQEAHLVALHEAGDHSVLELGDLFGVTRSTVYRALERAARHRAHECLLVRQAWAIDSGSPSAAGWPVAELPSRRHPGAP